MRVQWVFLVIGLQISSADEVAKNKPVCPDGSSAELSMDCRPCPSGMAGRKGQCEKCPAAEKAVTEMKMFALTTADGCAEELPYGEDLLTAEDSVAYFSTSEKGTSHNVWQQVILPSGRWSGDDVDYITWNFDSVKTVKERMLSAAAGGEVVHWVIEHQEKTIYKTGLWRFSDAAKLTAAFDGRGAQFSARAGAWGAAFGTVNGNGSVPHDFWGHGNFNSTDDEECDRFYTGSGTGSRQLNLRSYISVQTLPKECKPCDGDCDGVVTQRVRQEVQRSLQATLDDSSNSTNSTPVVECEDDKSWYFKLGGKKRKCAWISKQTAAKQKVYCKRKGKDDIRGNVACPETCDNCPDEPEPAPSPTPAVECEDDKSWYFQLKGKKRKCAWIAKQNAAKQKAYCKKKGKDNVIGKVACPETCDNCPDEPEPNPEPMPEPEPVPEPMPEPDEDDDEDDDDDDECEDDKSWYFKLKGKKRKCAWIAKQNAAKQKTYCKKKGSGKDNRKAKNACKETCDNCDRRLAAQYV